MLNRHLPAAALLIALAGCATPEAPPPPPRPVVRPPPPAPPILPAASDWRDWPVTPGDWHYTIRGGSSVASYDGAAGTLFSITCDRTIRQVRLGGIAAGPATIRTTSTDRALAAIPVILAANDPLLDAMGFSRGRFVVEQPGARPLVLPAWAEILRVTEDCRD